MDKDEVLLSKLADHYLITCRTEGKTASTLRAYREKLGRFMRWSDGACLGELSVELAREYISYLQSAPKIRQNTKDNRIESPKVNPCRLPASRIMSAY